MIPKILTIQIAVSLQPLTLSDAQKQQVMEKVYVFWIIYKKAQEIVSIVSKDG